MPRLYPRLDPVRANQLAEEHMGKTIEELSEFSSCEHSDAFVAPVGGMPIQQHELIELVRKVRTELSELGYPQESDRSSRKQFDYKIGKLLFEEMSITLGEAARDEVWSFLGCVMMPDVVAWRFQDRHPARFKGGIRNTFQRLWWRARVLYDDSHDDKFHLIKLPEDALVQIMERPNMMADWKLSRSIAHQVSELKLDQEKTTIRPEEIWRDASKRIRQRSPFTNLLVLNETELCLLVEESFAKSIEILKSKGG